MRTVAEVSKLTGVSVRTLHHYDAIGLLKPTEKTKAGYRLYDDAALRRLQQILLFRQLQFPLREIQAILDHPDFDPSQALTRQIRLLELQYQHIGELISFAREIQKKGVNPMTFPMYDKSELESYRAEARAKWGDTQAYREYEKKEKENGAFDPAAGPLLALFAEIGALRALAPSDPAVQEKIRTLQAFLTEHYYTCTREILSALGEMYETDPRFTACIDQAGGEGTAAFVGQAISIYCAGE